MKKNIFALLILTILGFSAQPLLAQTVPDSIQKASPEKLAVMQSNYLRDTLKLTPEQYTKTVDLFKKYNKKADETYKANMMVGAKIQIIRDTNADKEAQLHKILTPEQGKEFEALKRDFIAKYKQKITMK